MGTGIEEEAPYEVRVEQARQIVELERGDLEYADTYFLAKLIMWGNDNEKLVAGEEWHRRLGKDFPYHPSFEGEKYPISALKEE